MMNDILHILLNLRKNLNALLDTAVAKQRALITLNYEELENAILTEEKILTAIRECEQARTAALEQFYSKHSLKHESYKISELCEKLNSVLEDSDMKKLRALENNIKNTIGEVDRINHQNIYIIEHSRTFIKDTISSLISSKKSFLDKRV